MKTTILKWDYRIQFVLGVLNVIGLVALWFLSYIILFFQVLLGLYQLTSSAIHILLNHKSLGFIKWRMLHFWGSLIYLVIVFSFVYKDEFHQVAWITFVIIIPQFILYTYIWLCKKELDWLEHNEFHILK